MSMSVHKAEPFAKWEHHGLGTACQHCGQQIRKAALGRWVHSESGAVACSTDEVPSPEGSSTKEQDG